MKDNNGEEGNSDARYDKVDSVKQCLAADRDVKSDIWLRRRAAVISFDVFTSRYVQNVPLDTLVEVL